MREDMNSAVWTCRPLVFGFAIARAGCVAIVCEVGLMLPGGVCRFSSGYWFIWESGRRRIRRANFYTS